MPQTLIIGDFNRGKGNLNQWAREVSDEMLTNSKRAGAQARIATEKALSALQPEVQVPAQAVDGVATTFSFTKRPFALSYNGVIQDPSTYAISGKSLILTFTPVIGDTVLAFCL